MASLFTYVFFKNSKLFSSKLTREPALAVFEFGTVLRALGDL